MSIHDLAQRIKALAGADNIRLNAPMKDYTSFRVGGPADILVFPKDTAILVEIISACREENTPCFILGNGTNLVVRDGGVRGVVIQLYQHFKGIHVQGDCLEAQAGALLSQVAKQALKHQLAGIEFAEGIPGTLGGAVAMNAGAYGGEMKDVVVWTEVMDADGKIREVQGEAHAFGYRTSSIQREKSIVLRSRMQLVPGDPDEIKARMEDFSHRRRDKQPLELPSAGSVFKRPEGFFAGKLIEDCGLRGHRIGGAEVSAKHCGFIVNVDQATASDVLQLIRHIQAQVKSRFDVDLETEVRIIGEE